MYLFQAIKDSLNQLVVLLSHLNQQQYTAASPSLSGATIGEHMRHIIELYQCLLEGYSSGIVCYDRRKRDVLIETDQQFAKEKITEIVASFESVNKEMTHTSVIPDENGAVLNIPSNYYRELLYNLEHSIHHMALIRVGLKDLSAEFVPANFGVAPSTMQFRNQCAQ